HVMVQRRPRPAALINGLGLMLIAAAAVFGTHECPCAATAAGGTGLAVLLSKNFWLQQLQKMGMTL
ncbi:MAG TPA: hypothetical protein VLG71_00780, partial [Candidatus Limnocylindria bacterium]|nr:hypothetical protein [Candidatus Limnocylindria bacterium]